MSDGTIHLNKEEEWRRMGRNQKQTNGHERVKEIFPHKHLLTNEEKEEKKYHVSNFSFIYFFVMKKKINK